MYSKIWWGMARGGRFWCGTRRQRARRMEIMAQDFGCAGDGCVVASANKRRRPADGGSLAISWGGGDGRVWARLGGRIGWRLGGARQDDLVDGARGAGGAGRALLGGGNT